MIAQNPHSLKVEKTPVSLTSFAGLPLLTELAHSTGLIKNLDAIPGIWRRNGAYSTSDYVMELMLTLASGGETLEDTRILRGDVGLQQLCLPELPAANSLGDFLGRFDNRSIYRLSEATAQQALLNIRPAQPLTLDMDSTLIESDKKEAGTMYNGSSGYNPLPAWAAEADVFMGCVFRNGNASPQSHMLPLLKYCRKHLHADNPLRLRSDSAGYQLDIMEYCNNNGIGFTITADLDESVREVISNIPKKDWRLMIKDKETFLFAETVHAPGSGSNQKKLPAFRMIVTRKIKGQLELFSDLFKDRAIISNFPASLTSEQVLNHHNGRGSAEKAIGELKNGFAFDKLPCGELKANAAYSQICVLAYNLVRTFKNRALPRRWSSYCIKNLRFRLLCQAAVVIRHSRRLILKLSDNFPHFDVFEQARWSVLSPALSSA
ncbi:MAG: IS1380 family transposase [bacterium]